MYICPKLIPGCIINFQDGIMNRYWIYFEFTYSRVYWLVLPCVSMRSEQIFIKLGNFILNMEWTLASLHSPLITYLMPVYTNPLSSVYFTVVIPLFWYSLLSCSLEIEQVLFLLFPVNWTGILVLTGPLVLHMCGAAWRSILPSWVTQT